MATTIRDRAGRQRILEGLWLIGIEPGQLNIDPGVDENAFLDQLRRNGVHDEFIRRAIAGVDWRVGDAKGAATMADKTAAWLRSAGYRPDEVDAFMVRVNRIPAGGTAAGSGIPTLNDPAHVMRVLTEQFNERTAGAVVHKVTGGRSPEGAVWNPFRTDVPPKNVNPKFGSNGVLRGLEPERELPQGPTPTQQRQQEAAAARTQPLGAPSPTAPAAGTGPGGPGGTTPGTTPVVERLTPEQRLARLQASYGWGAAFADIPEVARILNRVANDEISADEANNLFKGSDWYRSTTANMREWHAFQKTDPEDAKRRKQANLDNITNLARAAGIANPDPRRLEQINDMALALGWSDIEVRRALAAEVRYDPDGAKTGTLAELKNMTREWLVPLSDHAMTAWAQSIVAGTKTMDDFREYNRTQAKSMFPGIGAALDDPEMTVRQYLDPYAQDTAQLLGINPEDIDWGKDPKYMRAFNQIDPKTNQRTIMSRADWQHTLMNDQIYGFDKTTKGQELKQSLTQGLMASFGFEGF